MLGMYTALLLNGCLQTKPQGSFSILLFESQAQKQVSNILCPSL